ncbi:hypothetical protein [Piscinibacter sp. XHJ-5]|uniref:hypothetical protein n=1 Tax=Piscinibacter sp. XHJ-5 TaxID=3037797 RepID=UPI002452F914|nr:hypothetical protein [Piscinibacter sp. XHJ-5]
MPCIDIISKRYGLAVLALLGACSTPSPAPGPAPGPGAPRASTHSPGGGLPTPNPVRSMNEVRLQAARRLVAANPTGTYVGTVPDVLLAIPVLEIELNADGSIRRIDVLRKPGQAPDTLQLAMDAVRRAAPFGDVSRLPKPWKFSETFLFNDERKFKPRTLDN